MPHVLITSRAKEYIILVGACLKAHAGRFMCVYICLCSLQSTRMLGCVQEMKTRYLVAVPIVPMPVVLNGRVTASSLPVQTQVSNGILFYISMMTTEAAHQTAATMCIPCS